MAVLWYKEHNGNRYEVRSAGNSRRLYRNGAFHSQFNDARPLCGGIWDLLMLPAFFHEPSAIRRVLMLGVGGGAVIRLLQRHVKPEQVIGVDIDPLHLEIAQQFFGLEGDDIELHCADARQWLAAYRGAKFDLIIDDLFYEEEGEAQRAIEMGSAWSKQLLSHLAAKGLLVVNFASSAELRQSALRKDEAIKQRFASAINLSLKGYDNAIGAFLMNDATTKQLRQRLQGHFGRCPDYTIRTLVG